MERASRDSSSTVRRHERSAAVATGSPVTLQCGMKRTHGVELGGMERRLRRMRSASSECSEEGTVRVKVHENHRRRAGARGRALFDALAVLDTLAPRAIDTKRRIEKCKKEKNCNQPISPSPVASSSHDASQTHSLKLYTVVVDVKFLRWKKEERASFWSSLLLPQRSRSEAFERLDCEEPLRCCCCAAAEEEESELPGLCCCCWL